MLIERFEEVTRRHYEINAFRPMPGRFAVIFTDVTEKKRVEESLRITMADLARSYNDLREKQEQIIQTGKLASLGQLAAGIAHEVNQPLTGISMGMDNVLYKISSKGTVEPEYLKAKCENMLQYVDRIRNIIEHIRVFSREQKTTSRENFNVNDAVRNACGLVQHQYRNHNVDLRLGLSDALPAVTGNVFKLEQVVINLLSNAKDAVDAAMKQAGAPAGTRYIAVSTRAEDAHVIVEVSDNGIGIRPADLEKVFDPFFTTKPPNKGTGLGLSITYGLVKEMDGEIDVKSVSGEGTTVRVVLPVPAGG